MKNVVSLIAVAACVGAMSWIFGYVLGNIIGAGIQLFVILS